MINQTFYIAVKLLIKEGLMRKNSALKKEKLKIIDSWKATAETLSDHKLLKDIKEGLKDIKAGRISRVRNKM